MVTSASAEETKIYSYDALGRLITIEATTIAEEPIVTEITYDAGGNRTNYSITGVNIMPPEEGGGGWSKNDIIYVVTPLNGFTLLMIEVPHPSDE